ncbi:MAG: GMP/IMP nucleotidase [Acidiferrobacterales bacterium]
MVNWEDVRTVLLDMDGTLLDLHYDNHFWRVHVPQRFAEKNGLTLDAAKEELFPRFRRAEGTLDWYCVDYWSRELALDIPLLKREVAHLISIRPHVVDFLGAVRACGKRIVLVTNAHGKSLALKLDHTKLEVHFDAIVCAHKLGMPKEHDAFWGCMQDLEPFDRRHALLVDDSLPVLRSARKYGISQLLTVTNPDSRGPGKDTGDFAAMGSFLEIMP